MAERERLDEAALRRPDWRPGAEVVLADGQAWTLRKPVVRFVPHDGSLTGYETCLSLAPDDGFQGLIDTYQALFADGDSAPLSAIAPLELRLGRAVLLANYDLAAEQVTRVLQFGYDAEADPDGWRIRNEVMAVVTGTGRPPLPAGPDSAP